MKKFVNFTVKTSVSASTFCHFHISVVGSYLRMCIVYKSIYSCPRRFFDVSGKKKVPPADADGTLVNGPRKTNATFGVACFSFGPIIPYTKVTKNNLFCYDFFNFFPSSTASVKTSPL